MKFLYELDEGQVVVRVSRERDPAHTPQELTKTWVAGEVNPQHQQVE
jgi:hypothetical protein